MLNYIIFRFIKSLKMIQCWPGPQQFQSSFVVSSLWRDSRKLFSSSQVRRKALENRNRRTSGTPWATRWRKKWKSYTSVCYGSLICKLFVWSIISVSRTIFVFVLLLSRVCYRYCRIYCECYWVHPTNYSGNLQYADYTPGSKLRVVNDCQNPNF